MQYGGQVIKTGGRGLDFVNTNFLYIFYFIGGGGGGLHLTRETGRERTKTISF